jgi:hypothetical protein
VPLARTAVGLDTEDRTLVIVLAPDLVWRWKHVDEFAAAIAAIARRSWPIGADWREWRPDPSWSVPVLRGAG